MKNILQLIVLLLTSISMPSEAEDGTSLVPVFQCEVDRRLDLPQAVQRLYAQLLEVALKNAQIPHLTESQYVLLVDRNPHVQAAFIYWLDSQALFERWHFIGASPASTGKPGKFDHFITPLGVFEHSLNNKDFRAEGTRNDLGIRGFGIQGMRVYDFGWVQGERGWGCGGEGQMRLLLHATDPDYLENRLGVPMSKGCIRIPATLNTFIDRYGILDGDYEQALARGEELWVLRADRISTPWAGRYLVIVDSGITKRPAWSPDPTAVVRQRKAGKIPAR